MLIILPAAPGLEPEIQKLITKHRQDIQKLKMLHEAELLQSDERAAQRYCRQAEELRGLLEQQKEEQSQRERELARQQYVGLVASGWHAEPTHGGFVVLSAVGIHVGQPQEMVSGRLPELCWVAYRAGWRESPVLGAQMS